MPVNRTLPPLRTVSVKSLSAGDIIGVHSAKRTEPRRCKVTRIHTSEDGEHYKLDTDNAGRLVLHHTARVEAVLT